jgi:hypothetical protein
VLQRPRVPRVQLRVQRVAQPAQREVLLEVPVVRPVALAAQGDRAEEPRAM